MNFNSFLNRNLYTQTGSFAFNAIFGLPSNTGKTIFGFSGQVTDFHFSLISGKIYDHKNNFISSYDFNAPINVSGNIGRNSIDYYINNEPLGFGIPRTTGYISNVYINPIQDLGNLDLFIYGNAPSYSITESLVFSTGTQQVPITFTNHSSYPIQIFSGDYLGDLGKFSLSGVPSGTITSSQNFYLSTSGAKTVGNNPIPITFYTNFGTFTHTSNYSGQATPSLEYLFDLSGPDIVENGNFGTYYCYFSNMSGSLPIAPFLMYSGGSGNQYVDTIITGQYSAILTGYIINSGNVLKNILISGSGYGGINNNYVESTINTTIYSSQFATGNQNLAYSTIVSGFGTGLNYSGPCTGNYNGFINQTIYPNSGSISYSAPISATPPLLYSTGPTGTVQATGVIDYNSPQINDLLYIYDTNYAIINGYSYTDINSLSSFINSNSSIYNVNSTVNGSQVILTSLILGAPGNSILFYTDSANMGNMSTTGPNLRSGVSLGIGNPTIPLSISSGYLNQTLVGSGNYNQNVTGQITGTGLVLDFVKTFTGTWNLETGLTPDTNVDFLENEWISGNNNYLNIESAYNAQTVSFYARVSYQSSGGAPDLAILGLSGVGNGVTITKLISGVQ